jgi:hypothetical protein
MHYRRYIACSCGEIVSDRNRDLSRLDVAMPCCGLAGGGVRMLWPSLGKSPLELAAGLDVTTDEGIRAACIFLCASLEALLEDHLWFLLHRLGVHKISADAIMKRVDGRKRMLDLFKDLTGVSAHGALDTKGLGPWFKRWEELVAARNELSHGNWHPRASNHPTAPADLHHLFVDVSGGALDAMVALRNEGFRLLKVRMAAS